jgi:hypothetical protein
LVQEAVLREIPVAIRIESFAITTGKPRNAAGAMMAWRSIPNMRLWGALIRGSGMFQASV